MKAAQYASKSFIIIATVVVALLMAAGIAWYLSMNRVPKGYVLVKSYVEPKGSIQCAAILPGCGDCSGGKVIHGKCYVPKGSSYDGL